MDRDWELEKMFLRVRAESSLTEPGRTNRHIVLTRRGGRDFGGMGIASVMTWKQEGAWVCSGAVPAVL